ncbi:MAG: GGDEF domain-containing protein [Oscillospiraceae bacterium]
MFQKDELFFKQLEKCIGEFYVIDEKTYELVYISDANEFPQNKSCQGNKCYEVLHERKSPCAFCPKTLDIIKPEFVDGYSSDSYVSNEKKWFQYKMLSYNAKDTSFRIIIKFEAESMMGLNREAIVQLTGYQNLYKKDAKIKEQLSYDATHDGMTSLYNKGKYLYDISTLKTRQDSMGIIVCDINNLKIMNDTFGHMLGDEIIRGIADALKSIENESTRCYRIGGDEFVVLQKHGDELSIQKTALAINEQLKSHHNVTLSLAIGWTICPPSESFEDAFRRADNKMYICKTQMKKELSED